MSDTRDPIVLLYCIDNNFLRQAGVALSSILESNPASRFVVNIAALGRDQVASEAVFGGLSRRFSNVSFIYHDLDPDLFDDLPVTTSISKSTYARLLLARFMDPDCKRVLYLDADTVVCADLRPLWETPVEDVILAAAPDHFSLDASAIGFDGGEPYFNAGVLLINLDRWRSREVEGRLVSLLSDRSRRLPWMDQDALNLAVRGEVRPLDLEWNFQPRCADVPPTFLGLGEAEYVALRARPRLVHYTTSLKPWNAAYRVHYSRLFLAAARRAGLAFDPTPTRPQNLRERGMQAKTWLRWHFPRAFRLLRRRLRPEAAALMYRARAGC